jgi:hypothetical protein
MNKPISFFSFATLLLTLSCKQPIPMLPAEVQVEITAEDRDLFLSDYADSIYYIHVEHPKEETLSSILLIRFMESNLIVHDIERDKFFLYDREGNFIRNIGGLGRGPEEYTESSGLSIDHKQEKIFIGDNFTQSILVFNLDGEMINRIPLHYFYGNFIVTPQSELMVFTDRTMVNQLDDVPTIHVLDYEGNTLAKTFRNLPYKDNTRTLGSLYVMNDRIHVIPEVNWMDTVFYVDANYQLQPYMEMVYEGRLDKQAPSFVDSLLYNPIKQGIGIHWPIFEMNRLIFLPQATQDLERKELVYDKQTKQSYNTYRFQNGKWFYGLINDIDGGPGFYPSGKAGPDWYFQTIDYIKAQDIGVKFHASDTIILNHEAHLRMQAEFNSFRDEDGVILQVVRFKN